MRKQWPAPGSEVARIQNGLAIGTIDAPKVRQVHKEGEVNTSAYFGAEVKASLRMVHAKTGSNVKDCLAEALRDLFRKYKVSVTLELGEGR
jgi:hypothetical protein